MPFFDIDNNGWLIGAPHMNSPHQNDRYCSHGRNLSDNDPVSLLVLHNISLPPGVFGDKYIIALFMGYLSDYRHEHPFFAEIFDLQVSAHFYINRKGSIIQFVSTIKRAWHAGVSSYQGRENCNDFSIGIELNGSDNLPYTLAQYYALAKLSKAIMKRHPTITPSRITTHSHIAPNRKTDPGPGFNHNFFSKLLSGH